MLGHASGTYSHNGSRVDISHNSRIDGYIHNSSPTSDTAATATRTGRPSPAPYCDEGKHWDITAY